MSILFYKDLPLFLDSQTKFSSRAVPPAANIVESELGGIEFPDIPPEEDG